MRRLPLATSLADHSLVHDQSCEHAGFHVSSIRRLRSR